MSGEETRASGAPAPGAGGKPADDGKLDDFVDAMDDPETIRRRGEAEIEEHDDAYYEQLAAQHPEQIEHELESFREQGFDVDGTGGGDTRPYIRRSPISYRPQAEREAGGFVVSEGGGESGAAPAGGAAMPDSGQAFGGGGDAVPGDELGGGGVASRDPALGDQIVKRLVEVHTAGMDGLLLAVRAAVVEIKAAIPNFGTGDLGALTQAVRGLEEYLRIAKSDAERQAETRQARWRWPLRAVAGFVALGLLVGGAAVQSRWGLLDDGTNGWKDIVWRHHGMKVAKCIDAAERKGGDASCAVNARVK